MKPTRTVSNFSVIRLITSVCPAGRSGTATSRGWRVCGALFLLEVQEIHASKASPVNKEVTCFNMSLNFNRLIIMIIRLSISELTNISFIWICRLLNE